MNFRSTYTKLFLSYIFITVLIISLLSVILYELFLNTSLKAIEADAKGRISQNINHLNLIKSRVFSLGQQLIKDSAVIQAIYGDEELTPIEQAALSRKLYNVIDSDSIIHSIFLYNAKTKEINDTFENESSDSLTATMLNLLINFNEDNKYQFIPNRVSYKKVNGEIKYDNVVSAVIWDSGYFVGDLSDMKSDEPKIGAIIINLRADAIQSSIAASPQDQSAETMILDKNGTIIFDSNLESFSRNIEGDKDYLLEIINSSEVEGTVTKEINGEKSMIVYKKTDDVRGWTFVSIYTYKDLFSDIYHLKAIIIFICIGVLTASLFYSVITAKKIYTPLKTLLNRVREGFASKDVSDRIENPEENIGDVQYLTETFNAIIAKARELESSAKFNIPMVKKAILKKMMQGIHDFEPELNKRFNDLFKDLVCEQMDESFLIVVFTLDEYHKLQDSSDLDNEDIVISSIEILINQLISEHFHCEPIDYESNYIYFLIKTKNEKLSSVETILNRIRKDLQLSLKRQISCAVGIPVKNIGDIHLSYSNALDMIKYRLVYGYGSFFTYNMEEFESKDSIVLIDKEKDKLIQAIKLCDMDGVKNEIEAIIDNISPCQYDYIMLTLNQLMLDILKSVKTFYTDNSHELDFKNIYININKLGTLDEMKEFFILYCGGIIDKIEKKKINRKSDMIADILNYIEEHYSDYDISTESLARIAKLTPGYFGKVFAECTGKTVNEHILELRMAKAKELLKASELTVNEIALKVGFSNSNYFITQFRKSFGLTPNQYRTL